MSQVLETHSGSNQPRFHNFKEGDDDSRVSARPGWSDKPRCSVPGGQTSNCRLPGPGWGKRAPNSRANPPRSVIKRTRGAAVPAFVDSKNAVDQDRDPVAAVCSALQLTLDQGWSWGSLSTHILSDQQTIHIRGPTFSSPWDVLL